MNLSIKKQLRQGTLLSNKWLGLKATACILKDCDHESYLMSDSIAKCTITKEVFARNRNLSLCISLLLLLSSGKKNTKATTWYTWNVFVPF